MAILEHLSISTFFIEHQISTEKSKWVTNESLKTFPKVAHIFFDNGEPWHIANKYALDLLKQASEDISATVTSNMTHLRTYASWLENNQIDWRHFPKDDKSERCLVKFRGYLISKRNTGKPAASTASNCMSAVLRFYRWVLLKGLIDEKELWKDNQKIVSFYSSVGFTRTINVLSSELAIPNKKTNGNYLEDGLLPISEANRGVLIEFLKKQDMVELYLMFLIGFFSGARSESIRTLRVSDLERVVDDPVTPNIKRLLIGPGTRVRTKFKVKGSLIIPAILVTEIQEYAFSLRRLTRASRASEYNRNLLFITQRGNPFKESTFTKLMSKLRTQLTNSGLNQFHGFKFHQARATFGTQLMKLALQTFTDKAAAIRFVRDAMFHKHERTTWKYITFIEEEPLKESISDEFFNLYTGVQANADQLINQVTFNDIA